MSQYHIVHRDLKPENILIQVRSTTIIVKICDFGLSYQHSPVYQQTKGKGSGNGNGNGKTRSRNSSGSGGGSGSGSGSGSGTSSDKDLDVISHTFCGSPGFFAPECILSIGSNSNSTNPIGTGESGYSNGNSNHNKRYSNNSSYSNNSPGYNIYKADVFSVGCIGIELLVTQTFFVEVWLESYKHYKSTHGHISTTTATATASASVPRNTSSSPPPATATATAAKTAEEGNFYQSMRNSILQVHKEIHGRNPSDYELHEFITGIIHIQPTLRPSIPQLLNSKWIANGNKSQACDVLNDHRANASISIAHTSQSLCYHSSSINSGNSTTRGAGVSVGVGAGGNSSMISGTATGNRSGGTKYINKSVHIPDSVKRRQQQEYIAQSQTQTKTQTQTQSQSHYTPSSGSGLGIGSPTGTGTAKLSAISEHAGNIAITIAGVGEGYMEAMPSVGPDDWGNNPTWANVVSPMASQVTKRAVVYPRRMSVAPTSVAMPSPLGLPSLTIPSTASIPDSSNHGSPWGSSTSTSTSSSTSTSMSASAPASRCVSPAPTSRLCEINENDGYHSDTGTGTSVSVSTGNSPHSHNQKQPFNDTNAAGIDSNSSDDDNDNEGPSVLPLPLVRRNSYLSNEVYIPRVSHGGSSLSAVSPTAIVTTTATAGATGTAIVTPVSSPSTSTSTSTLAATTVAVSVSPTSSVAVHLRRASLAQAYAAHCNNKIPGTLLGQSPSDLKINIDDTSTCIGIGNSSNDNVNSDVLPLSLPMFKDNGLGMLGVNSAVMNTMSQHRRKSYLSISSVATMAPRKASFVDTLKAMHSGDNGSSGISGISGSNGYSGHHPGRSYSVSLGTGRKASTHSYSHSQTHGDCRGMLGDTGTGVRCGDTDAEALATLVLAGGGLDRDFDDQESDATLTDEDEE